MKYEIQIEKRALKFIEKQARDKRELLFKSIARLPDGDTKPLRGQTDIFRLRVGTYRVLYRIDNGQYIICVIDAGSRGQIYNRV